LVASPTILFQTVSEEVFLETGFPAYLLENAESLGAEKEEGWGGDIEPQPSTQEEQVFFLLAL